MNRILTSLLVCGTIGLCASPAYAQYYGRPRMGVGVNPTLMPRGYIGFSGLGTAILNQSGGAELIDNGGGVSLWGGIRFGPIFALELDWMGSFHNPAQSFCDAFGCTGFNYLVLETLNVDAKIHFPTNTNFDPFVQGGAGFAWIGREGFTADAKGGGIDLGGGFDLWLNYWWTFGIRGLYRGVSMSDYGTATASGRTFVSMLTVDFSLAAHF